MATIQITITRTGQTIPTKNSTITDAALDQVVSAYQADADSAIGGTATYAQVLNFAVTQWYNQMRQRVQQANTVPASVPAPINLT